MHSCYNQPVDDLAISSYFIEHLSEYDNPDDLIMVICEKTGRPWNEIETLLEQVRKEYDQEITHRRSPLLTAIALVTFGSGVVIMIYSVYLLVVAFQVYSLNTVPPLGIINALQAIFSISYTTIVGFGVGLAMALGSLIGMRQVWIAILKI